jgi:predicted DNA-binding transcriptional regulator AlpA
MQMKTQQQQCSERALEVKQALSKDEAAKFAAVLAQNLDEATLQQVLASLLGGERPAPMKEYLRSGEVQKLRGVSRSTFWGWRRSGILPPSIKLSPGVEVWRRSDIIAWIAAREVDAA